jgi:hypothetical protein
MMVGKPADGQVTALRIALLMVPPLLAGLIRHCVGTRITDIAVTEVADLQYAAAVLRDTGVDVVIVGPSASASDTMLIRSIVPDARVLTISADSAQLINLDTGEAVAFTPDALANACARKRGPAN